MEKKALGKGLNALIMASANDGAVKSSLVTIAIHEIKPNRFQPRIEFDKERLDELVNSIREKGIIQPIIVRKTETGYELIAGERRLRAAQQLGMTSIPSIIKNVDDIDALGISLIENIQREDLNPIEEANAYQRFVSEFKVTQEEMSKVLGKDRSTIANTLRLLALPKKIQDFISKNSITAGHGRALLAVSDNKEQERLCAVVVKRQLSVRETEQLVARRQGGRKKRSVSTDSDVAALEDEFRQRFGTRVTVVRGKRRGRIVIEYYSPEDLERIIGILRGPAA